LIAAVAISIAAIGGVAFADAPTREEATIGKQQRLQGLAVRET